ncbi:MAG TPA: glycoside hydrolase family 32 protein [Terracidiphilus sp.]|jgi:beta-fructofuranosidase|nr:glycoside hydrolase family 32 protein [Terracidiphilus sp.]
MTAKHFDRRSFLAALGCGAAAACGARALAFPTAGGPDTVPNVANDPARPAYHLLPPHNWMNDPNGPIWWKGKYHLFYQLNPHAAVWGDMHWGHAVSPDMIHWHHESIALTPTPGGADSEGCFSGSAVVYNGVPTFIYTGVQNAPPDKATIRDGTDKLRETQMIATAEDDGLLRWKKLETPVIATPPRGMPVTGFRDPCPWKEADGWYVGIGSGERFRGGCVLLYRSQDLRTWEYLHQLASGVPNGKRAANPCDSGEMWECPDFFPLGKGHYLHYSTENKVIWTTGDYNAQAHLFTPKRSGVLDHGAYYAPKTFLAPDGRRILWGWIRETRPEKEFSAAGWAGCMSLPRVLAVGDQGQLEMRPAAEIAKLRGPSVKAKVRAANPFRHVLAELRHELRVPIDFTAKMVKVRLLVRGTEVWQLTVNLPGDTIRAGDVSFPLPSTPWPRPHLLMFLDGSVIESFIGGREAVTSRVYTLKPGETEIEVSLTGSGSLELDLWPLQAISPDRLAT